jgi:hypothetical protein
MGRHRRGFERLKWGVLIREADLEYSAFSTQHSVLFCTDVQNHGSVTRITDLVDPMGLASLGEEGDADMKNFKDLQVWEKAHSLTLASYKVTNEFRKQEMYGMSSQIRRCAASIPANIAEGCGK